MIEKISQKLIDLGLFQDKSFDIEPIAGGVSSYVWRVFDGQRSVVVKYPRESWKLPTEWSVSVVRSRVEQNFFGYTSSIFPENIPVILHGNCEEYWFCMEFFDGFECWKTELLKGKICQKNVKTAAKLLSSLHTASKNCPEAETVFSCSNNFEAMRIEPYFGMLTSIYPEFSDRIEAVIARLLSHKECLIHGDFSPKNILVGERMVIIDGEAAWYGDGHFDVAFMINHLLLKGFFMSEKRKEIVSAVELFLEGYGGVEDEKWLVELVLWLMLARIDGKSPVEYLDEKSREKVRDFVLKALKSPTLNMKTLLALFYPQKPQKITKK